MKSILLFAAASTLALGLAACAQKPVAARAKLDCPASEGALERKSTSADGKSCVYASGDAEVTLQLISTPNGAEAALDALEAQLTAGRVPAKSDKDDGDGDADKAEIKAEINAAKAEVKAAIADAKAAKAEAKAEAAGDKDVTVRVAGGKVDIEDKDGGKTHVNLPGIHIEADDEHDSARVQVGPIHINANGDEATVKIRTDHRMRGEALSHEKRGLRAMFISKVDGAADGYKYVGYEAAGPKTGPITVGVIKSKSGDDDDLRDDLVKLVRRNGGV